MTIDEYGVTPNYWKHFEARIESVSYRREYFCDIIREEIASEEDFCEQVEIREMTDGSFSKRC